MLRIKRTRVKPSHSAGAALEKQVMEGGSQGAIRDGRTWVQLALLGSGCIYNTHSLVLALPTLKVKVTQSCSTLCDPTDYIIHGIL